MQTFFIDDKTLQMEETNSKGRKIRCVIETGTEYHWMSGEEMKSVMFVRFEKLLVGGSALCHTSTGLKLEASEVLAWKRNATPLLPQLGEWEEDEPEDEPEAKLEVAPRRKPVKPVRRSIRLQHVVQKNYSETSDDELDS